VFVLAHSAWRGRNSAGLALLGLQLGYAVWWVLAGFGLGALMAAAPWAYRAIALAGAGYLAWLGIAAWRHAGAASGQGALGAASAHPLRDGIVVALGNPKALIYMVAVIPPFIDAAQPLGAQLLALAVIAGVIDVMVAAVYIAAGDRIAARLARPHWRAGMDRAVGAIFLVLALGAAASVLDAV
jgi:threonine/homoserine/homoserine lactone efflux protein